MIKNRKKTMLVLSSMIISSLITGCKEKETDLNLDSAPKKAEEIMEVHYLNDKIETNDFDTEIIYSKRDILKKLEEYYEYCGIDYNEILNKSKYKLANNQLYVAALYMRLKVSGKDDAEIIDLLDDIYYQITLPSDDEILLNYYYPLAGFVHQYSCIGNHSLTEDNIVKCDRITKELENKYLREILKIIIYDSGFEPTEKTINAYNRIKNNPNLKECLDELENVYAFSTIPTDYYEEEIWQYYFSNLDNTLEERESLFDIYYDLATLVHEYNCQYSHHLNEYGTLECDGVKLILDNLK